METATACADKPRFSPEGADNSHQLEFRRYPITPYVTVNPPYLGSKASYRKEYADHNLSLVQILGFRQPLRPHQNSLRPSRSVVCSTLHQR